MGWISSCLSTRLKLSWQQLQHFQIAPWRQPTFHLLQIKNRLWLFYICIKLCTVYTVQLYTCSPYAKDWPLTRETICVQNIVHGFFFELDTCTLILEGSNQFTGGEKNGGKTKKKNRIRDDILLLFFFLFFFFVSLNFFSQSMRHLIRCFKW